MIELFYRDGWNWVNYAGETRPIIPKETLYWEDTFPGAALDETTWYKMPLVFSAGNSEDQWYMPGNVEVSGGTLKIWSKIENVVGQGSAPYMSYQSNDGINRAHPRTHLPAGSRPFSSGMINTRNAPEPLWFPLFSRFEMRGRLPHGQGLLPAFWLRRKDGGAPFAEVDIMEYFGNYRPGRTKNSLHFPNSIGVNAMQVYADFEPARPGTGDWHVWDVEIRPALENPDPLKDPIIFEFHLDGRLTGYFKVTDETCIRDMHMIDRDTGQKTDPARPNLAWDICINTAVGGKWVGQVDQQLGYLPIMNRCSRNQRVPPGGDDWGASCDLTDLFFAEMPALFEVDYVRVYDLGYHTW